MVRGEGAFEAQESGLLQRARLPQVAQRVQRGAEVHPRVEQVAVILGERSLAMIHDPRPRCASRGGISRIERDQPRSGERIGMLGIGSGLSSVMLGVRW